MQMRLALVLLFLATGGLAIAQPVFYVAPNGDDTWTGTQPDPNTGKTDGPFATLLRARDALREARADQEAPGGATIYIRAGAYYLDAPLELGAEDSGAPGAPVLWRAYRNESVRLVGGLPVTNWEDHENGISKADLSDLSLPDGSITQVFVDGSRQDLARWPNAGDGNLPGGGYVLISAPVPDANMRAFEVHLPRFRSWKNPDAAQVSIWPNYNWWQTIAEVESIDPETGRVTLESDLPYTIEPGRRLFFQNIREELDAPGEWYFDSADQTLYLKTDGDPADQNVVVDNLPHLIQVTGGKHINFIGLSLEVSRHHAARFENAEDCLFAKAEITNTGGYGIVVEGGRDVRIMGNDIHHTGKGGIVLDGGDRKTLTKANHQAVNNHIHHYGNLHRTYQTAVNIRGVGQRVANNLIHDAPHIGLHLNGNDHLIEYNHIHHVCLEGSDNGGFYMGRDWTQRGIVIRFNKFHDIYGFGLLGSRADKEGNYHYVSPFQAWGIYLDDCTSGVRVFGNLFYRVPLCGVMIGGGRDNLVENNIFVDCIPALHIDDRWDGFVWDTMQERLEAMNVTEPPYSDRYPELVDMGDDPRRPENNKFLRNIVVYEPDNFTGLSSTQPKQESALLYHFDMFDPDTTIVDHNTIFHYNQPIRIFWSEYGVKDSAETLTWEEWLQSGFDLNSQVADPMFMDPETDDYDLRVDSPALLKGFKPLPTHRMGLYQDEFRISPPPGPDPRRGDMTFTRIKRTAPAWPEKSEKD